MSCVFPILALNPKEKEEKQKFEEKEIRSLYAEERVRLERGSMSTFSLLTVARQLMKQNPPLR